MRLSTITVPDQLSNFIPQSKFYFPEVTESTESEKNFTITTIFEFFFPERPWVEQFTFTWIWFENEC